MHFRPHTTSGTAQRPRSYYRFTSCIVASVMACTGAITLSANASTPPHPVTIGIHIADEQEGTAAGKATWSDALSSREMSVGAKIPLVASGLRSFARTFPSWEDLLAKSTGHQMLVNWAMGYPPGIVAGRLDAMLRSRAQSMKAFGSPIILAYAPAMDSGESVDQATPSTFIAAWRHTKSIFAAQGVTNVKWAFCPSALSWSLGTAMQWYPGSDVVDLVCARGLPVSSNGALSFAAKFDPFVQAAGGLGKPLMVSAFGAALPTVAANAAWIAGAFDYLTTSSPEIAYAVYNDSGGSALSTPAALAAFVTGYGLALPPPDGNPDVVTGPLVPASGTLLGALLPKVVKATEIGDWNQFVADSGSNLDVAHLIYKWGLQLPTWREQWHIDRGRIPMISWGGYQTSAITNGSQDTYIRNTALGIKALGTTVFLRWFWEMDGHHFDSEAGTPSQYVAAWAHIRSIFTSVGATNVAWVWAPTAYGFATGEAQKFYPGAALTDWIAADGFNSNPQHGDPSESFASIYGHFYTWAAAQEKPLMVAAVGTVDGGVPQSKADWLRDMGNTVKVLYPNIKAVVYFNRAMDMYSDPAIFRWQLDSSPESMAAWRDLATQPFFSHNN